MGDVLMRRELLSIVEGDGVHEVADRLEESILTIRNPDSVAAAAGQPLSMPPAQRRERHDALFQVLSHNDIQHWADRFLAALESEPTALSQLEQMPSVES
jgi:trehalose-6-phosphate synthase